LQPVRHDPDADYLFLLFTVMLSWTLLERGKPNLAEAFADLGMNPSRAFLMISLPLSMPGIAAGFTLSFCPSFGDFIAPFLVVSQEGNLIALVIQTHFGPALKWPLGSALSIVMLEIILSIVSLSDRVKRGSATGGA
jgi:spermidine/putrescine transport system permease protein